MPSRGWDEPTTNRVDIFHLTLVFALQKYRITKRVGGGSFGDIYLGVGANGEKVCWRKSLESVSANHVSVQTLSLLF